MAIPLTLEWPLLTINVRGGVINFQSCDILKGFLPPYPSVNAVILALPSNKDSRLRAAIWWRHAFIVAGAEARMGKLVVW